MLYCVYKMYSINTYTLSVVFRGVDARTVAV